MRKSSFGILILLSSSIVVSQTVEPSIPTDLTSQIAKVRAAVQKRGIGEKSRVKVRLRNKEEIRGYISEIEDASFNVTDRSTGQATTVAYANVERVQGVGLSKGAKIGIIVGVGVAIVVVVFAAEFKAHGY